MTPLAGGALLAMAALVPVVLWAERADRRAATFLAKGAASACFLAAALAEGLHLRAPWLAGALALSFAGDLLLVPRDARVFRGGIGVFLLAHVAYMGGFAARGLDALWAGGALLALVPLAVVIARWVLPRVPRVRVAPVVAYVVVITVMVALAAGTRDPQLVAAAALFYANDVLVARDRFVEKAFANRAAGLPMYYAAQALFALSA